MAWRPVPERLLKDYRVLDLDRADRAVLLSLYLGADQHGRFDASERVMRCTLALVDGEVLCDVVERLSDAGLVHLYQVGDHPYGVIDRYDDDMGADMRKRRPASGLPDPPSDVWSAAKCDGVFRGGQHAPHAVAGHVPDSGRTTAGQAPDTALPDAPTRGRAPAPSLVEREEREEREERAHAAPGLRRTELAAQLAALEGAT